MSDEKTLESLREAIRVSPDNVPLRMHLAELLMRMRRYEDSEHEYREALRFEPENRQLKLALAYCFFEQSKNSEALVLVESLTTGQEDFPEALILHSRLLIRAGDLRGAAFHYRSAIDSNPELADETLADQLGVPAQGDWQSSEEGEESWKGDMPSNSQNANEGPDVEIERPEKGFENVGGMDSVKEEIRLKIIHPLSHPEIYEAYGKPIGGGILMYGPPGCGKTHLARATAGEVDASFLAVGIHDVLDMWIGNSEKQLHEIFEHGRRNSPCVLFFDEVDAIGASRTDMKNSSGRHLINQFLSELDGVKSANDGLLVLAATNAPWHLDSAFRRPGRFDRVLFVPPPDLEARASILQIMLSGKPTDQIDYSYVAKKSDGFSGADLKAVVDIAIEAKLQQAMSEGIPKPLTNKDLMKAVKQVKPSTKEWFSSARNYALYSNQGGAYDDILDYLNIRP